MSTFFAWFLRVRSKIATDYRSKIWLVLKRELKIVGISIRYTRHKWLTNAPRGIGWVLLKAIIAQTHILWYQVLTRMISTNIPKCVALVNVWNNHVAPWICKSVDSMTPLTSYTENLCNLTKINVPGAPCAENYTIWKSRHRRFWTP